VSLVVLFVVDDLEDEDGCGVDVFIMGWGLIYGLISVVVCDVCLVGGCVV